MHKEPDLVSWIVVVALGVYFYFHNKEQTESIEGELADAHFKSDPTFGLQDLQNSVGEKSSVFEGMFPSIERSHINAHGDRLLEFKVKKGIFRRWRSTFLCVLSSRELPLLAKANDVIETLDKKTNSKVFVFRSSSHDLKLYKKLLGCLKA